KEENLLERRSIQPTAIRILVLRYLLENNKAVSLKSLETHFAHSDRSSLFRTLKTFEAQKLVHSIDDGSGMTKYALCLENCQCEPKDQHFHFHCVQCEETFCLTKQHIPSIQLPPNFRLQEANLVLKGVCANCN
ncbi:MAG: transcriptional repressor, partial [Bacteroidota bacterium]